MAGFPMSNGISRVASAERPRGRVNELRKKEFAGRLVAAMNERGLTSGALTQRVRQFLPRESHFQPANLSQYRSGIAIPKRAYLEALCKALDIQEEELLPPLDQSLVDMAATARVPDGEAYGVVHKPLPAFLLQDEGDGRAWLQFNQRLPWSTALRIVEILG